MPTDSAIAEHRAVQHAAQQVLEGLAATLHSEDTESSIVARSAEALRTHGLTQTWYHDCLALVLLGSRSCLSLSGRQYEPASEAVGRWNLITVDLSPARGDIWGDCARSFYVEEGCCRVQPRDPAFSRGKAFLGSLHAEMLRFVTRATTFHQLFEWSVAKISAAGFENLDFAGNVGHSIATRREECQYIEDGNHTHLSEVPFFTFEPHVRTVGGRWGFKHEDVFFFTADGRVAQL